MTDSPILARSRGLVLQRMGNARFEIQVESDRIAAGGLAFLTIVMAIPTVAFAAFSVGGAVKLVAADSVRVALAGLIFFGGMALGCGFAVWSSLQAAVTCCTGLTFEIDTERQVLTMRRGRRNVQSFSFSEIAEVKLSSWRGRAGRVASLSIELLKSKREILIQEQRLAEYGLEERLDEVASVGGPVARLMHVSFTRQTA